MKKKQSSVEWFIERIEENTIGDIWENVSFSKVQILINVSDYLDLKEQAKAIHKEEVEDAYRINPNNEIWSNSGIDYYNETFGEDSH